MPARGVIVNSGGSSTPLPPPSPGNVTLGTPYVSYSPPDSQGKVYVHVVIPFNPPATLGTWDHVTAYLQAPDDTVSTSKAVVNTPTGSEGFFIGTSGVASTIAPNLGPIPFGPFKSGEPAIVFDYPAPAATENWAVYAVSGSTQVENPLVTVNEGGTPSPHVVITVNPVPLGGIGEEYAPLADSFTPLDPLDFPHYERLASGDQIWSFTVQWTNKTYDPRYPILGGYDVVIEYPDGNREPQASPGKLDATADHSDYWPVGIDTVSFTLWLVSWDVNGRRNTIVPGVTPSLSFTVGPQTGAVGTPLQDVTNFSVTAVYTSADANGKPAILFTPNFTPPDDPSWNSIAFWVNTPMYGWVLLGFPSTGGTVDQAAWEALPTAAADWTFLAISLDAAGKDKDGNVSLDPTSPPAGTPSFTVHINTQPLGSSGQEYAPLVSGLALVGGIPTYSISSDGVELWGLTGTWLPPSIDTHPTYGGLKLVLRPTSGSDIVLGYFGPFDNSFKTDQWPIKASASFTLYAVSIDTFGRENTLVPGTTPSVGPFTVSIQTSGLLRADRNDPATLAATLAVNAALLGVAPHSITNASLTTSEITVGGASGSKTIRFRIFDAAGSAIGWIGDDSANSGFVGAWFQRMYVGGSGPVGAPFSVDSNGRLSITLNSSNIGTVPFSLNVSGSVVTITDGGFSLGAIIKIANGGTFPNILITSSIIQLTNAFGVVTGALQLDGSTNGIFTVASVNGTSTAALRANNDPFQNGLYVNGTRVVGARQGGPGNTSDVTDVAIRFNNLLFALRSHGLIT